LVLLPDSNSSRDFNKWKGPAKIVEVVSPYSYLTEMYNGRRQHLHANRLRKYNMKVDEVECTSVGIEVDCSSAVIYDRYIDFGRVEMVAKSEVDESISIACVDAELPSQKIDSSHVSHLTPKQWQELFDILDKYSEHFSEKPGFCSIVECEIPVTKDFKPKRLPAYREPENLKASVNAQIAELLRLGIITPSKSPMSSPVVCVLKGQRPADGVITPDMVRICVNYQYVEEFIFDSVDSFSAHISLNTEKF
jgi:hypothetical protein